MEKIISIIAISLFFFFAIVQKIRNRQYCIFVFIALMFCCSTACPSHSPSQLLSDVTIAVLSVVPMVLSLRPSDRLPFCLASVPVVIPVMSIYYILCSLGIVRPLVDTFYRVLAAVSASIFQAVFIWMIWRKIRDVKSVMKSGNVWSFVNLCVDCVYVISPLFLLSLSFMVCLAFPGCSECVLVPTSVVMILEVLAVSVRMSTDSAFAILHDHERIIVESMKISHLDMSSGVDSKGENMYKELYERVVLYFEMSRPYLDGDLTINDVVKEVYSNKVYISKAICHYTGRNFRQFVNYYRVMYSMDLFRNNLEFKVAELAEKSGFNTVVSYTMAFRLFMNETPSEWCRKERAKILKQKK